MEETEMSHVILSAIAAMVLLGLADFFIKKGVDLGIDIRLFFFYSFLIAAIPFGLMAFVQSGSLKLESSLLYYSMIITVLLVVGTLVLLLALKKGEASIVVPIARLGFVVTAVCAFIFIGEQLTVTKGLGILFAIAGILLLSKEKKGRA
jgi:uncharacterized membrane protein